MKDHVDYIIESWAEEDPEIDMEAFHVIGRVMRLAWIFESAESGPTETPAPSHEPQRCHGPRGDWGAPE